MISITKLSFNTRYSPLFSKFKAIRLFSSSQPASFEIDVKSVKNEGEAMQLIKKTVESNPVVLFMKGNASRPLCGFSNRVTQILFNSPLNGPFATVNVLANEEVRVAIKKYSDWPTVPQLYVKGKFVGGCDIVYEMYVNGSFIGLLKENDLLSDESEV